MKKKVIIRTLLDGLVGQVKTLIPTIFVLVCYAIIVNADVIELKDGKTITGEIISIDEHEIKIKLKPININRSDIKEVVSTNEVTVHNLTEDVEKSQALIDHKLYKKISMHEHYRSGGNIEAYINAMGQLDTEKSIFVPTGLGPDNRGYEKHMAELLEIRKKYPNKIYVFATIDEADINAANVLEDAVKKGAVGLKLLGWHPSFYDEEVDSEKMYKVYKKCKDFNLPILIHISMKKHEDWQPRFARVLKDFPDVTFIAAHYGKFAPEVEKFQRFLDEFSNLYFDVSMGGGVKRYTKQITLEPDRFRDFIIKNQNRVMWGTDIILSRDKTGDFLHRRIMHDLSLFQSELYLTPYSPEKHPVYGLHLPHNVLEKMYYKNAIKIFPFLKD